MKIQRLLSGVFLSLLLLLIPISVDAVVPYYSYSKSELNYSEAPSAFEPVTSASYGFNNPQDLYIYNDLTYVANTGNHEVVVLNNDKLVTRFLGDYLVEPVGISVHQDKLYIADKGLKQVVITDLNGNILQVVGQPVEKIYGDNPFVPIKVDVDASGNMYIVSEGVSEGIVQLDKNGNFVGFFGANSVSTNPLIQLQKLLYTKEKEATISGLQPASINNIAVDSKGVAYLTTKMIDDQVRQLNILGSEMGIMQKDIVLGPIVDVFIDNDMFVYVISENGYIVQMNYELEEMVVFGGRDTSGALSGFVSGPTGIAVDSQGRINALDGKNNVIQIYEPTSFDRLIKEAEIMNQQGMYQEARSVWQAIVNSDVYYAAGYNGLAKADFKDKNYDSAIENYRLAYNQEGSSDAYWEKRNILIQKYLIYVIILVIVVLLLLFINRFYKIIDLNKLFTFKWLTRFKTTDFYQHYLFSKTYMKHPIDGVYRLKFLNEFKLRYTWFLILILLIMTIIFFDVRSFIFTPIMYELIEINYVSIVTGISLLLFLFVIANTLVSSIMEGEGSLKNIFKVSVLSTTPFIFYGIFLAIITNVLTLNESFIYSTAVNIIIVWMIVNLFISLMELHNFGIVKTLKNVFITLAIMLIIVVIIFVVGLLLFEEVSFVIDLMMEVIGRG
jgi:sugar lactone lactonase YvrE